MKVKKIPKRMCVACRIMKPKKELIRIVRDADKAIFIDKTGKKSGKGAYLCPSNECVDKAMKINALERALETKIPQSVFDDIKEMIN